VCFFAVVVVVVVVVIGVALVNFFFKIPRILDFICHTNFE